MITKEQKDILDDIEYSCDTLKETNRGKQILADVRNDDERWYDYEQFIFIYDGLKFLGRKKELERAKKAIVKEYDNGALYLNHNVAYQFCQEYQDNEALYLIAAGLFADGQDEIAVELANDLNDYCKHLKESRLRKGRLVKESRLSPRFTKLLKESSSNADYENYSYICVEVEKEDGRYEDEWKEGDILNPDDVVEIMKSAETINGTAEIDTYNKDSETYGDGCSCIVITLSTADNDEEEEKEVCKYWLMPRVDTPEVIDGIADSIEKASEN